MIALNLTSSSCNKGNAYTIPSTLDPRVRRFERGRDVLLVDPGKDGHCVDWVLLECSASGITSKDSTGVWRLEPDEFGILARGSGFAGNLREARHTYFAPSEEGEHGYVFYIKPRLLAWAFDCLREWFDFDDGES